MMVVPRLRFLTGLWMAGATLLHGQMAPYPPGMGLSQQVPGGPTIPASPFGPAEAASAPFSGNPQKAEGSTETQNRLAQAKADEEQAKRITQARSSYKGPMVLASDLFDLPGHRLPIPAQAAVGDDYQLGVGDQLLLYAYGSATFEVPLVVDRRGDIAVPKVGTVHVAGQSLGNARSTVLALVRRNFSNTTVDLQFQKIRDVRVYVLGEVFLPGAYVMPSLTSLIGALSYAGGPTPAGSYRHIRVIRDGRVLQEADLYPMRMEGTGISNLQLQDGDTVFVPLLGVQVRMEGEFIRAALAPANPEFPGVLVELKPGESAWDAVHYIGGLLPSAYPNLITLERHLPTGVVEVKNLPTDMDSLHAVPVFMGDVLRAMPRVDPVQEILTIKGHVRVPGVFAIHPGMRLQDALLQPNQILPDTYMGRGQIVRTHADLSTELLSFNVAKVLAGDADSNVILAPKDRIELYSVNEMRLSRRVTVLGPFTHPGDFAWHEHMRAADLIFEAGVPRLEANRYYAELAHMQPDGKPSPVVKLDLQQLLYTTDSTAPGLLDPTLNPELQPYDQITLYEIPDFRIHKTVTLSGQVARPGPYVLESEHETLSQLIARAGGLTEDAMPSAGIFLRSSLAARDLSAENLKASGTQDDPTLQNVNAILDRLNERKLGKVDGHLIQNPIIHGLATGALNRMVVNFPLALKGDGRWDVELQDGDQVLLPRRVDTAYVVGEVASPFASYKVHEGVTVRTIVGWAGGFTRNADSWNVRLLKADGRILDSWVMRKEVEPGDVVLVPQKFKALTTWQDNVQALTPLAILLTAIRPAGGW